MSAKDSKSTSTAKSPAKPKKAPATITEQLKAAILASDLTQYRIAKSAGVDPSLVNRFVAGKHGLRLDSVDALAQVLGLELRAVEKG